MSDGNIENSWVVEVTHDNAIGICTDDIFKANEYNGFEFIQNYQEIRFMGLPEVTFSSGGRGRVGFEVNVKREFAACTEEPIFGRGECSYRTEDHTLKYNVGDIFFDYIRQTNDLPEDTVLYASEFFSTDNSWIYTEHNFDTQEATEEFVNNFEIAPIATINNDDVLCKFSRDGETEGHSWTQHFYLRYSGDTVKIYTLQDWINFFATILGTDGNPFAFGGYEYIPIQPHGNGGYPFTYNIPADEADEIFPIYNCSPSVDLKSIELLTGVIQNRVIVNYNPSILDPTSVTVTTVIEEGTNRIENGNGSVAVHDNGNIIMLNDGGTFFLNEFGNVGFYANGDASLTADNQVQLGVGQNSVTVENGSLTIRDETGSATLTAEDINRLKETLV